MYLKKKGPDMFHPVPSTTALCVNNLIHNRPPVDAVPAFRSIEDYYHADIRLSHLGIIVRSRLGMGDVLYKDGAYDLKNQIPGKAVGKAECDRMRHYALKFLLWADTHLTTPEVTEAVKEVTGGKH